jgi:uncharacterized protein YndB with AHSA1/START domain
MTNGPEAQQDRDFGVRRRIWAPRTFLYRAWTDSAQFVRWFGTKKWTAERCEITRVLADRGRHG